MGSDRVQASYSGNYPKKSSNYDEIYMQENLQFADNLMDLKNLRKQLYSAAEYFEASYEKDENKEFVVESSKDYVSKAIVSTVDHLGSIADKLNKFLEEKADEFSETKIRFSCVEQKLNTIHRFVDLKEMSKQMLLIDHQKHQKRYISPANGTSQFDKSNVSWKNCTSCPKNGAQEDKTANAFTVAFRTPRLKPQPTIVRKGHSRNPSRELSPNPTAFSFTTTIPNEETGKRSASPLRFTLKRSGSFNSRSVSPSKTIEKQRFQSEPRRAIISSTKVDISSKEREIVSYSKKSKSLFNTLLSVHKARKGIAQNKFY